MAEDRMYDLAFAFKNTRLWETLSDMDLFAVRLPEGEVGYCCVMGRMGSHFALAVYVGDEGFRSYRCLASTDMNSLRPVDMYNMMASQSCLQCSFENRDDLTKQELADVRAYARAHQITVRGKHAYPQFRKQSVGRLPWPVHAREDEVRLCEALLAALEVHRRLLEGTKEEMGLKEMNESTKTIPLLTRAGDAWRIENTPVPAVEMISYPEVELMDQLLAARLKKRKKQGVWECAACYVLSPIQADAMGREAPYYPLVLIAANLENGMVPLAVVTDGSDPADMAHQFAQRLQEGGSVPATLRCGEERSFAMLRDLCEKTGIAIEKTDTLEILDDALPSVMDQMRGIDEDEEEDDWGPLDDGEGFYHPMEHLEDIASAISEMTDEELKEMPRELKNMLRELVDMDVLPEKVAQRIRRVLRRKR